MTARRGERRLNVAASRACNQMWVVHSLKADDFPAGDPRAELIRHCEDPSSVETALAGLEQRCESQFERDVLRRILGRGFHRVRAQWEVGRYRIDLVVEGAENRLAIECDGDTWHGPDQWDADRARQQKLERAGWTFERIRGSVFYRDPDRALEPLWDRLAELGIGPSEWSSSGSTPPRLPSPRIPVSSHSAERSPTSAPEVPAFRPVVRSLSSRPAPCAVPRSGPRQD